MPNVTNISCSSRPPSRSWPGHPSFSIISRQVYAPLSATPAQPVSRRIHLHLTINCQTAFQSVFAGRQFELCGFDSRVMCHSSNCFSFLLFFDNNYNVSNISLGRIFTYVHAKKNKKNNTSDLGLFALYFSLFFVHIFNAQFFCVRCLGFSFRKTP